MLTNYKTIFFVFILVFTAFFRIEAADPPFLNYLNDGWVNQQLDSLTMEEKIAQLMMVTVYPTQNEASKTEINSLVNNYKPGGILVMQGDPVKTATWINEFQENSKIPLLVAVDGEWGLAMRIDSTVRYPNAQAVGAVQDSMFVYQMGRDIGNQMKQMGIHVNFAPVADVNTNPENPVINFRSFGENRENVAEKTWQIARGIQDAGVIPVAKHFPGHGDTQSDSHLTLPLVNHSRERIDEIESYPFRYLAEKGISGIMSAHLNVPSLDDSGTPSSLSKKIITDYLKNEIGFNGFVVTDAINMKGVQTGDGNAEVEALKAGNDLVEFVPDLQKAIQSVKQAVENGEISEEEITEKTRKILALKRFANLHLYEPASTIGLTAQLNSPNYEVTNRKLTKGALTVLANKNVLPVEQLDSLKIASLMIGTANRSLFQNMLSKYTGMDHFQLDKEAPASEWNVLQKKLANYDLIISGVSGINGYPSGQYGTTEVQREAVSEIATDMNSVVVFFGNAYALKYFQNIQEANGLILAYQDSPLFQELAAQLVFGGISASGELPVSVGQHFQAGDGIEVEKNNSFSYTIPEELGINSAQLRREIDSIVSLGIESAAYPGCQILAAKNGQVFFHECYGYHTYYNEQEVLPDDVYDWASLTKVTGPLPALMQFVEQKKMNLDGPFSDYWPDFKGTDKERITLREILAHQARLPAWIPFWSMALDESGHLDRDIFKNYPASNFNIRISDHLFMNEDFKKTMFDTIRNTQLLSRKRYVYSGLSFYLFPDIIANISGESYEDYIANHFFKPLGASSVTYNPYKHYPMRRIIPTEIDDFFRMEKLQGFVHDEGAAMMGGVSGNAGLFGTTDDLAKIFQMYLQKGFYGGRRYITEETIDEFIRIQYPGDDNRRGLGFDKPYIDNFDNKLEDAYPAVDASVNSFGHTGYTGTFAWADPDTGLLFIFMSNRVYPTRNNEKLYDLNIRVALHQAFYNNL